MRKHFIRYTVVDGQKQCSICKTWKPVAEFGAKRKRSPFDCGVNSTCRPCKKQWKKDHAAKFSWTITDKIRTRFASKVATPTATGCTEYLAAKDKDGYGLFYINGRQLGAHRVAWAIAGNMVPDWPNVIDHRCYNPACVNVAHLRVVPQIDNTTIYADRSKSAERLRATCAAKRALRETRK